jgi:hypothetical protein
MNTKYVPFKKHHCSERQLIHSIQQHKAEKHAVGQPTIGDKISGTVDKVIGQITRNPAKVQEGEMKKGQI